MRGGITLALIVPLVLTTLQIHARFDLSRDDNLVVYWGQGGDGTRPLSKVCQDDNIDAVVLAFLAGTPTNSESGLNLWGAGCSPEGGSCRKLAQDIRSCQDAGKIVLLSVGGATSGFGVSSTAQAKKVGELVYNKYLGGDVDSKNRPLGDAVLDGIDLDIEGGSTEFFAAFVNHMWDYARNQGDTRKYYLTGAPQCPFPDAYMKSVLNSARFDAVWVQFYNNACGLTSRANFNFDQWHGWAKGTSANKNVKIYIGALADKGQGSGYVDANTLQEFVQTARKQSSFGGVMLWEDRAAMKNGNFASQVKRKLSAGASEKPIPQGAAATTDDTSTDDSPPTDPAPSDEPEDPEDECVGEGYTGDDESVDEGDIEDDEPVDEGDVEDVGSVDAGSCNGIDSWNNDQVYTGGEKVNYNGRIYVAAWWSKGAKPTGEQWTEWKDQGPC